MEEIINFLSSLNRLTIISFFITLVLLIYQIILLKQEVKKRRKIVDIPNFKEDNDFSSNLNLIKKKEKNIFQTGFFLNKILIVIILFLVFLAIFIFNLIRDSKNPVLPQSSITIKEEEKIIVSPKIKIYNDNWEEITEDDVKNIMPGKKVYVGIENINDPNIDMARIKINQGEWDKDSITTNFNQEKNIFFREYFLSTNEAFLKIEAQLHSKIDGWLGN